MSINKKIIHFKHESDFKNKIDNNEIQDSSIVFIKDSNKIYTHGEEYSFVEWNTMMVDVPDNYNMFYATDGAFETQEGYIFVKF